MKHKSNNESSNFREHYSLFRPAFDLSFWFPQGHLHSPWMWNCCCHGMAKQTTLPLWSTFAMARLHHAAPELATVPVVHAEFRYWLDFRKRGLPLSCQSRGGLWIVSLPVPVLQGGLGVCSASLGLLFLGQAHVHLHWPPQFSLQWGSPGSIGTYWVGRPRVPYFWTTAFGLVSHMVLESKGGVRVILNTETVALFMATTVSPLLAFTDEKDLEG